MNWREIRWNGEFQHLGAIVQLCDRMLQALNQTECLQDYLSAQLPELATEFSAQEIVLWQKTPTWKRLAELGRSSQQSPDFALFEEALDRGDAGFLAGAENGSPAMLLIPLEPMEGKPTLLTLEGPRVSLDFLTAAVGVGRFLSHCLLASCCQGDYSLRLQQMQQTLKVASELPAIHQSEQLLEYLAESATQLLDCDRASIFVWDQEHKELTACPALGVEGNTLRLPDSTGIVGEVVHSGQTLRIDDAASDKRFNQEVDKSSGYQTRNLLCSPLRNAEGKILGAFEVINKNTGLFTENDEESLAHLAQHAAAAIENTWQHESLARSRDSLTEQVTQGVRIIGNSPAVEALRNTVERLAGTDLPVLILGESGTGKEVVAQSLHYQGPRENHPFIAVNCAAIAETLLESELFGHEKGAFTDAHDTRKGKFELAEGGTLFLDEVGDMSLGGQAKLLRVLEQKVITRVGGSQDIPINVRIIAATNADLLEKVREKEFREDLYYRLSVVTQQLQPLRERPEDILTLAEYFLQQFSLQARRPHLGISNEARLRLQSHNWPGNVRELRNLMERVAFLSNGDQVEAEDLAFILSPGEATNLDPSLDMGLTDATSAFQRDFIRKAIKRVNGNMSEAARLMGLHRSNLYRKMRNLEMKEAGGEE